MKPFEIVSPATLSDAHAALADDGARVFAGGTDLLGEMKQGTAAPARLVDIGGVEGMRGIVFTEGETRIGGLTTLAEIERDAEIAARHPALSQAAASVATPQIRNAGTLGGNLCQRPRCWYYRSAAFDCRKKGGDVCFATAGGNKYHAIFGPTDCRIVHPSDTAVALMSLGAEVEIFDGRETRRLAMGDFFVSPERDILSETALRQGEILTGVIVPNPPSGARGVYIKAKERQAYDFALVSAAAYAEVEDGVIREARIALGGVAPTPHTARSASDALRGESADAVDAASVGRLAVEGATPMSENGYKVRLAANLVARAVNEVLGAR